MVQRYLIILRGVPAVGKSSVSALLKREWGDKAYELNLDDSEKLDERLTESLSYRYVICEIFSGRSRAENPQAWISKFKNYSVLSVVLEVSREKGFQRAKSRSVDEKTYNSLYDKFQERLQQNNFASRGGVREIVLDANDGDYSRIVEQIIRSLERADSATYDNSD